MKSSSLYKDTEKLVLFGLVCCLIGISYSTFKSAYDDVVFYLILALINSVHFIFIRRKRFHEEYLTRKTESIIPKFDLRVPMPPVKPYKKPVDDSRVSFDLFYRELLEERAAEPSLQPNSIENLNWYKETYGNTHEDFLAKLEAGEFDIKRESK